MPRHTGRKGRRQGGETVRETAAGRAAGPRGEAAGREPGFRVPRSIDEGKKLFREAPDALREKARERLQELPAGAQKALDLAQEAAGLFFASLRVGLVLAREVLRVPAALVRALRREEA